jgi:hypothetical protein
MPRGAAFRFDRALPLDPVQATDKLLAGVATANSGLSFHF